MKTFLRFSTLAGGLLGGLLLGQSSAHADSWHHGGYHGGYHVGRVAPEHWRPAFAFHPRVEINVNPWRAGRWAHEVHAGRLAWWWVAGEAWYPYAAPVYPYPVAVAQPVAVAPQQEPWYWCPSAQAYYPYVSTCPEAWVPVAPQ